MFDATRTITDDRGREVRRGFVRVPPSERAELAVLTMAPQMKSGLPWLLTTLGVAGLAGMGCCVAEMPVAGLVIAFLVLSVATVARIFTPSRLPTLKDQEGRGGTELAAWLLADACPACGYSLAGLREGEDGCVECPECSAAWALARWKRDHPPFLSGMLDEAVLPPGSVSCWVTDARGRAVEAAPMPVSDAAVTRAGLRMWFGVTLTACATIALGVVMHLARAPVEATGLVLVLVASVLGLASLEVRRGELIAERRRMVAGQRARGECVRCQEPLPADGAISDGALVCGRCGAAWQRPRERSPR